MAYRRRHAAAAAAVTLVAAALAGCDAAPTPNDAPDPSVAAAGPGHGRLPVGARPDDQKFRGAVLVARGTRTCCSPRATTWPTSRPGPPTRHTRLFRIGSLTKQFTALAVLKLQELGQTEGHGPGVPAHRSLPRRMETDHRGAIAHPHLRHPQLHRFPTTRRPRRPPCHPSSWSDCSATGRSTSRPGSRWRYSNSGYAVLGYLIERTHRYAPTPSSSTGEIFDPLGLSETGYDVNQSHRRGARRRATRIGTTPGRFIDMSISYAAGAMYSSVSDLFRVEPLPADGHPADRGRGHPRGDVHATRPDRIRGAGSAAGTATAGFVYRPRHRRDLRSHGGSIEGFTSYNLIKPREQLSITILSNGEDEYGGMEMREGGQLQCTHESSGSYGIRRAGSGPDRRRTRAGDQGKRAAGQGSRDDGESNRLRIPVGQALHQQIVHRAGQAADDRPRNEFAGMVAAVGSAVTSFEIGDRVFGFRAQGGAHAEYLAIPRTGWRPCPPT